MITPLILFSLFLLQFVYLPFGTSYFEGSKVYTLEIIVFLLLFFRIFSKQKLQLKNYTKGFLLSSGLLLLLCCYHVVFFQSATVLFGNAFRLQGTLLLFVLLLFSFLTGSINLEKKLNKLFVFGAIVAQFVCTLFFIGVGVDRPIGTIGEPNALAATVLFLWPFLFFPKPKKRREWMLAILGVVLVVGIVFVSGSRSGIIALIIQSASLFFLYCFYGKPFFPVLITVVLMLASYVTPFFTHDIYENRSEIWKGAVIAGEKSPLLGVGFGNAEYALHQANIDLDNGVQGYYVDSSHNIFLDWFVQGGIVALLILLFLLAQTFFIFVRRGQVRNIVLLFGVVTALSFNPASVVSLIALWWLIGQAHFQDSSVRSK